MANQLPSNAARFSVSLVCVRSRLNMLIILRIVILCITLMKPAFAHNDGWRESNYVVQGMNHIFETLTDFKHHLLSQQAEYIIPIQSRVTNLTRILDMIRLFHAGVPINNNVIAKKIQIKPNNSDVIGRIHLSMGTSTIKYPISILSSKLNAVNFNFKQKNQFAAERKMNKRSSIGTQKCFSERIKVRKLSLHDKANFKSKSLSKQNMVHHLNGKITVKRLIVRRLEKVFMQETVREKRSESLNSLDRPRIVVTSINSVNWDGFVRNTYRKGLNTVINGNIILTNSTNITNLFTEAVDGLWASNFITISTDQIIKSNVFIPEIFATGVIARLINEIPRFEDRVVLLGQDNVIKSRVRILHCIVENSLKLSDDEGENLTEHIVGTHMDDLTQIYNGKLIIKGPVDVKNICSQKNSEDMTFGRDFQTDGPAASVESAPQDTKWIVNGIQFDPNIGQKYWMKSVNQDISDVNFTQPIVCPQATITRMGGLPIVDYFIVDDQVSLPKLIYFQANVKIAGNLFTEENSSSSTLQKLSSESIARLGNQRIMLDSTIIFKGNLQSNHITMLLDTGDLVRKSVNSMDSLFTTENETVRKHFKNNLFLSHNIIVANSNANNITVRSFNEFASLSNKLDAIVELLANPAFSTRSVVIFENKFHAKTVQTISQNLIENRPISNNTGTSRSHNINQIMDRIFNAREQRIQSLVVNGVVRFLDAANKPEQIHVDRLNGIELDNFFPLIVLNDNTEQKSIEIGGAKTFISELNVTNANTVVFNKQIVTSDWYENAFRSKRTQKKDIPQIIESPWQFNDITLDNLQSKYVINDVDFASNANNASRSAIFVDDDPGRTITIVSDISLSNMARIGVDSELISTELRPCNLQKLIPETVYLLQRDWYQLNIYGNVKLLSSERTEGSGRCSDINCFFKMAISSKSDESIGANIEFNFIDPREKFSFNQITSKTNPMQATGEGNTLINNINFIKLYNDAVTRITNENVDQSQTKKLITFTSQKELLGGEIIFSGSDVTSSGDLSVQLINQVNINNLNQTLFYRDASSEIHISPWQNLLFLNEPQTNKISIRDDQTINGAFVANLFFIYSAYSQSQLSFRNHINEFGIQNAVNSIFVEQNVHVNVVNGMSLQYFMDNRFKMNQLSISQPLANRQQIIDGFFTFENLVLTGDDIRIDQINDAICNEIVLKNSAQKQEITGYKKIGGVSVLAIEKPFHLWKINDAELVSVFSKTILLNHKQLLERVIIRNPYQLKAQREAVVGRYSNDAIIPSY